MANINVRLNGLLVLLNLCFLPLANVAQAQTSCSAGVECIGVYECPALLNIINKPNSSRKDIETVRSLHCGFRGRTPLVCCINLEAETTSMSTTPRSTTPRPTTPRPTTPPTTPPPTAPPTTATSSNRCFTPDAQEGRCISLYSCQHLTNLLTPPSPMENIAFVQSSRCQGPEQYSVCCGPSPPNIGTMARPTVCTPSANPPDPVTQCCGIESSGGNRIFGGNETAIDQYPWLVIIEYKKDNKIKLLCGGVLISGKYVLTAGHCVVGPVLAVGTPANVRLGEYDTSKSGPDCVETEGGGEDCTSGELIVPIEKIVPHPGYNPESALRRNDIALLRLSQMAPYSDFIRPICLPSVNLVQSPPPDLRLYAAGWGAVSSTESSSKVKLHVSLPFRTQEECQQPYTHPRRRVTLWQGQICAGGEAGKDSCKGDSGGPLMRGNGQQFEVVGIVSFGPTPCGLDMIPGVYTYVYEYLDWIRSQIQP